MARGEMTNFEKRMRLIATAGPDIELYGHVPSMQGVQNLVNENQRLQAQRDTARRAADTLSDALDTANNQCDTARSEVQRLRAVSSEAHGQYRADPDNF